MEFLLRGLAINLNISFYSRVLGIQYTPDNSNLQGTDENGSS